MIQKAIINAYKKLKERNWDTIYWAIDLHDTCLKANYDNTNSEFINNDAKECLEYISSLPESKIIWWTSTNSNVIDDIDKWFTSMNINSASINCNPFVENTQTGCFDEKFYFSILLDDKA